MKQVGKIEIWFFMAVFAMVGLVSCAKEIPENYLVRSKEYCPYQKGNIRDYDFDSTSYDWLSGKVLRYRWFVRETVTDSFRDLAGDLAFRLEQFRSYDSGKSYQFYALNTAKISEFNFQRVEENQRYTKLTFPISDKKKWDGNIYNSLGFQEYEYIGVGKAYVNRYFDFPDCIFVSVQDDTTFISTQRKAEIYAKDVGLVYRLDQDVKYKSTGEPQGYFVEWRLRKFWAK